MYLRANLGMARRVVTSRACVNGSGVSVVPDSCDLKRGKQPRNNVVAGNDGDIKESQYGDEQSDSLGFIFTIWSNKGYASNMVACLYFLFPLNFCVKLPLRI